MGRGLDHAIHVVRDLDVAGSFYQRLGFQVGARNKHPWGTANRIVQLPGFFVEILGVAEPDKIPPMGAGTFSFGAFNRDFLVRKGEGPAGLVLESKDAAADKIAFDQAGFGGFAPLEFSRKAVRADGSETEVGFSIAFARDPASPDVAFFTCRQKAPENFWSAELQRHANGAQAIAAAVFVAENPTDHHIFLETFSGSRDVRATSLGRRVACFPPGTPADLRIRSACRRCRTWDCGSRPWFSGSRIWRRPRRCSTRTASPTASTANAWGDRKS